MTEADASIPSPCVRNCCLNDEDVCLGCFRTVAEICLWSQADKSTRLQVLSNAEQRRESHHNQFRLNNLRTSITPTINT